MWEISWDCASFLGIDCGGEWVLCAVLWCTWSTGIEFCSRRTKWGCWFIKYDYQVGMLKCTNWDIFCTVFVTAFLEILFQGALFCVQGVYVTGIVC